jgi:pimeloyl-ACP methyl ester carboxylesterase
MPQPDVHPLPGREIVVPAGASRDGRSVGALRLHVVEHGAPSRDGKALPLLMLHGLPATSYLWRDVARDLEHDRLCVMPDLAGCGESERPSSSGESSGQATGHASEGSRLEDQASLLLRLLDQLGLERVAVLGADLGGTVAVQLAARARDRVAALALVGTPLHPLLWPTTPVVPLLVPAVGEALLAALRARPRLGRRVVARALGARLPDRELDRYLAALRSREDAAAFLRLVRAVDLRPAERAWEQLCADPLPTLVLWGTEDALRSPAYGRRLVAEMPGAIWAPVAGAGHLLPAERPERVAEEVAGFLAEL